MKPVEKAIDKRGFAVPTSPVSVIKLCGSGCRTSSQSVLLDLLRQKEERGIGVDVNGFL